MSTVLDAVRERDGGGVAGASLPLSAQRHRSGWLLPALALGLACAALLPAVRASWRTKVAEAPLRGPAESSPPVANAADGVAPPVQSRPAIPLGEPPRARVGPWPPLVPLAPMVPGTALPLQEAPAGAVPPASPEPAARSSPSVATRAVHLESIRYGSGLAERAATLVIDGATPVTLRQGESAGDVEVQLVLPQAVYVRRGAEVFALGELR